MIADRRRVIYHRTTITNCGKSCVLSGRVSVIREIFHWKFPRKETKFLQHPLQRAYVENISRHERYHLVFPPSLRPLISIARKNSKSRRDLVSRNTIQRRCAKTQIPVNGFKQNLDRYLDTSARTSVRRRGRAKVWRWQTTLVERYPNVSRGYVTQLTLVLSGERLGRYTGTKAELARPKSCSASNCAADPASWRAFNFEIGLH